MNKILTFLICTFSLITYAQVNPDCSPNGMNSIYVLTTTGNYIYRVDNVNSTPSAPVLVDSIFVDVLAGGLSIGRNINTGNNLPTFYSVVQSYYYYRDNSGWINTGHLSSTGSGNIGGGVNQIFNHRGTSGSIYRYDGNGNDAILVFSTSATSIYDIATDSIDNFYVLVTDSSKIYKFDSLGTSVDTFQVTGIPQNLIQPGFTLLGNTFYVVLGVPTENALLRGTINGNTVSFSQIAILNVGSLIGDIAACPFSFKSNGVNKIENELHLLIFPNPTSDILKIETENNSSKKSIQIINYEGKIIYENQNFTDEMINTKEFSNGLHLLKYSDGKNVSIKRFVVQH